MEKSWEPPTLVTLLLLATILCLMPLAVHGEEAVSAKYLSAQGHEILLEIGVSAPAPSTIIVIQHLTPGTAAASSTPRLKTFDTASGTGKWLLQNIEAGKLQLSIRTEDELRASDISSEIRYRDPSTGVMKSLVVRP